MTLAPPEFNLARYCLAGNAQRWPEKAALVFVRGDGAEERWTFGGFTEAVLRLAGGLRGLGMPKAARVMIRMRNGPDIALLFFAAIAAELVPLPSSAQLAEDEARFLAEDAEASLLFASDDLIPSDAPCDVVGREELARLKSAAPLPDFPRTQADDPAFLIYTSGTTGRPKGVLHAQRTAWGRRPMRDGWHGFGPDDRVLHAGQMNWTYTLGVGLMDPWAFGATAVLYDGPKDPTVWPRLIARYGVTVFAAVPTVYRQILKYCSTADLALPSLRHGLTAGEALAPDLLAAWRTAVGTDLFEALGMSEISTYISSGPVTPVRPGSPGRPQPGRRVAVLPVEGGEEPLPAGEIGLLAVHRSDPGLMLRYWRRPEEERTVYRGEWFIGGDLATFDADGYVWHHGRNDDIMNAFGYRVSPMEVERVLADHPAVADVAVAEVRVRPDVSVITAFVVLQAGAEHGRTALLRWAEARLAPYKCPREVRFVAQLPRTANGKIIRSQLASLPSLG